MRNQILLGLVCLSLIPMATCGAACKGIIPEGPVKCNGVERVRLDCTSEVQYQGVTGQAGISVLDVVGITGSYEEKAIRKVSDQVQEYLAMQGQSCRNYNACIEDPEQYRSEAADIRKRIMLLPTLTEALKNAKSEGERMKVLDQLYRGVLPDEKRTEEVTFQLGANAQIPEPLGGGSYNVVPGSMVPTGAQVAFTVSVSKDAYVYMFQTTPSGEISVMFPDPRIGTQNPLRGGLATRIPQEPSWFRLNAKDIGTENLYVVVSQKPVENLDAALNKVKSGQTSSVKDDHLLQHIATVVPKKGSGSGKCGKSRAFVLDEGDSAGKAAEPTCSQSRGFELDTGTGGAQSSPNAPGMAVRTSPGDDMIVQVFPVQHVTEEVFRKAGGTQAAGKTRGIAIED